MPPDESFIRRRFDRRVSEIWSLAADDPDLALMRAKSLHAWLGQHRMTGDAEQYRRICIAQLSDLIRFLTF